MNDTGISDGGMRNEILAAINKGDLETAERLCSAALKGPHAAMGVYLLAAVKLRKNEPINARSLLQTAAVLLPNDAEVAHNFGVCLSKLGEHEAALREWRRAVTLNPDLAEAWRLIGMAHMENKQWDEARHALNQVRAREPDDVATLIRIAILHDIAGELAECEALNRHILTLSSFSINVWVHLAESLNDQGRFEEAEACYRQAIEILPESRPARFNYASLLLSQGRWREGFAEYEWRYSKAQYYPGYLRGVPEWTGKEPVGTKVALWNDQGYGDVLHFSRFIADVVARGHEVYVLVAPALKRLLSGLDGVAGVLATGDTMPVCAAQIALSSLPHALAVENPAQTWRGPYLPVAAGTPLPKRAGRRSVGLVWAGDSSYASDEVRSLTLARLEPLLAVEGVDWWSLQVGPAREQIEHTGWNGQITDVGATLSDFADTAAVMQELDLIITVDTAVAHLAGALGRPTWVMLRALGDWRWQLEGESTDWYPSLRLFRQPTVGDWETVIASVVRALQG